MKPIALATMLVFVLLLTGCPKNQGRMPEVLVKRVIAYEAKRFDDDLAEYQQAANDEIRRQMRDQIVVRLKRNIDAFYHDFERDLFYHRATSNIAADFVELAAAGATGITNGERAKSIMAIALTAFKGGRKSIDQNFFQEQTTKVLISAMRAARSSIEAAITEKRSAGVQAYSLDDALGDLVRYFYAGTLQNALQELTEQTSMRAEAERHNANEAEDRRISQEIQAGFDESAKLRQILRQLKSDIDSQDQAKINAAQQRLLNALNKLKGTLVSNQLNVTASDPPQKLYDILVTGLRTAYRAGGVIAEGKLQLADVVKALEE